MGFWSEYWIHRRLPARDAVGKVEEGELWARETADGNTSRFPHYSHTGGSRSSGRQHQHAAPGHQTASSQPSASSQPVDTGNPSPGESLSWPLINSLPQTPPPPSPALRGNIPLPDPFPLTHRRRLSLLALWESISSKCPLDVICLYFWMLSIISAKFISWFIYLFTYLFVLFIYAAG